LEPTHDLASAPTFSRLEHQIDRQDLYRLTQAFVDAFIASYAAPPAAIVLDLDYSDDPTYGQQALAFSTHHYQNHCYVPFFIFAGHRMRWSQPPASEHTPAWSRKGHALGPVLSYLRHHWPQTHIPVRGDSHYATPEVIDVIASYRWTDFVFGFASNAVLLRQAAPIIEAARQFDHQRVALVQAHGQAPPPGSRLYSMTSSPMLLAPVLHPGQWTSTLHHTAFAQAQPSPIILTLFTIAVQVKQYKDRRRLHLPSAGQV
jgi:hypothetical protein